MWNGAVGSSWKADRKTVKLKLNISAKRAVNSRSGPGIEDDLPDVLAGFHPPVRVGPAH